MRSVRWLSMSLATIVASTLPACCPSEPLPPPFYSPHQAATRTAVPLVRPFPLVPMTEPYVLDFDLLPPQPHSASSLTIALRASDASTGNARDITQLLRNSDLNATVILTPLDPQTPAPQLYTIDFDVTGPGYKPPVPIAADGRVRGVTIREVDSIAMDEAGLTETGKDYGTVSFAEAWSPKPGRYRVELQLIDPAPELASLPVELLLAYERRLK